MDDFEKKEQENKSNNSGSDSEPVSDTQNESAQEIEAFQDRLNQSADTAQDERDREPSPAMPHDEHDRVTPYYEHDTILLKKNRNIGWIVAVCVVLSGVAGFGGGFLASRVYPDLAATAETTKAVTSIETTPATQAVVTLPATTSTTAQESIRPDKLSIAEIAKIAYPSVVAITTEVMATGQELQQYVTSGAGSGVILSSDGLIITCSHVIEGAQKIFVRFPDSNVDYTATLVGADNQSDIAILKVSVAGLKAATIGDSSTLVIGDIAVAIGNPLGELGGTVTNGIISSLDRKITLNDQTMNLLQTNASINPGNSGGGLFDSTGSLIGIVNAKSSGTGVEGLGFAIPINDILSIRNELIKYGYVRGRIDLGMTLLDIDTRQMMMMYRVPQLGVYIARTTSGGSADAAGLATGDCILSVDGTEVRTTADINNLIEKYKVGDSLTVIVLRNNKQLTVTLTLQESIPISGG